MQGVGEGYVKFIKITMTYLSMHVWARTPAQTCLGIASHHSPVKVRSNLQRYRKFLIYHIYRLSVFFYYL